MPQLIRITVSQLRALTSQAHVCPGCTSGYRAKWEDIAHDKGCVFKRLLQMPDGAVLVHTGAGEAS